MSVTRKRAKAIAEAKVRREGHVKMGVCPVCEENITSNQRTAHRLVNGTSSRIHASHLAPTAGMGYDVPVPPGHERTET